MYLMSGSSYFSRAAAAFVTAKNCKALVRFIAIRHICFAPYDYSLTYCLNDSTRFVAGAQVETTAKAVSNKAGSSGPIKAAHKLENETEVFEHERVSTELKKQIQQARLAKKLTQAQLAQMINEKPQIINEYESGRAIPNPQILSKMSRVLGVTLRKNPAKK
jgi:putative transcription factor